MKPTLETYEDVAIFFEFPVTEMAETKFTSMAFIANSGSDSYIDTKDLSSNDALPLQSFSVRASRENHFPRPGQDPCERSMIAHT
jgi:hypothetical protein